MKVWLFLWIPAAACAHMVSMSTGELKVEGNRARYELKMPSYEAVHVQDPGRTLLQNIHFRSSGVKGKLLDQHCGPEQDNFVCVANYEFPAPAEVLDVDCTFAKVTVPNHVHLLRAYRDDKSDQAVFDLSFTTAEVRFRPPAPWEIFVRESGAGFLRAVGGLAPLLFLLGMVLAARSRRELLMLAAAFLAGEVAACLIFPHVRFGFSPRFIEAAAALTIAYLAFEIVLLPGSGQRWLVVAVLGLFHGAYFSLFLISSSYHLPNFLSGVIAGELLVLGALAFAFTRLARFPSARRIVPIAASLLLTVGVAWFVVRVWT